MLAVNTIRMKIKEANKNLKNNQSSLLFFIFNLRSNYQNIIN